MTKLYNLPVLALLATVLFISAACSKVPPITIDQANDLKSSLAFEDQNPESNAIKGPVSIELSDELTQVIKSSKDYDSFELYISNDENLADFEGYTILSSVPFSSLIVGVNQVGYVPEGSTFDADDKLILAISDSEEETKNGANPINVGLYTLIDDYVVVKPTVSNVKSPTVEPVIEVADVDLTLQNVQFDYDQSIVKPEYLAIITAELLANIGKLGDAQAVVSGHADSRGTQEYNLLLGERRAQAVKTILVDLGIQADKVQVISYGEERPLDPQENEEAWATNRRAETVIEFSE